MDEKINFIQSSNLSNTIQYHDINNFLRNYNYWGLVSMRDFLFKRVHKNHSVLRGSASAI